MASVQNAHLAHVLIHLPEGIYFLLVDHVRYPNQSFLAGMFLQVPVDHVVSNVDLSIGVPTSKLGFRVVQDLGWEFKPTDFFRVLLPVGFSLRLRIGSFTANLVRIL